jgi:hypothetical protein
MSSLFDESKNESSGKGRTKLLLAGLAIGLVIVAIAVAWIATRPTETQVVQQSLEGAFREGSPEFETYTKRIVARTDEDRTMRSPTAMGTTVMSIGGELRNLTGKTITGLEVQVTVVDLANAPLKERAFVVVPKQKERLAHNESMQVQVNIGGFESDANIANIRWKVTAIKLE